MIGHSDAVIAELVHDQFRYILFLNQIINRIQDIIIMAAHIDLDNTISPLTDPPKLAMLYLQTLVPLIKTASTHHT